MERTPLISGRGHLKLDYYGHIYRAFSHDVTAAIFVYQNNETAPVLVYQTNETVAIMLVYQTNPVGVKLFSYVKTFFCSNKFA